MAITECACGCGVVAFSIEGAPQRVINCHCGLCRRLSGSAFATWASFSRQKFRFPSQENVSVFAATENIKRHFCRVCGTHVFSLDVRYPQVVGVPAGIILGELPRQLQGHYFVSHKAAWHTIGDPIPQFGGESGFEPLTHNAALPGEA